MDGSVGPEPVGETHLDLQILLIWTPSLSPALAHKHLIWAKKPHWGQEGALQKLFCARGCPADPPEPAYWPPSPSEDWNGNRNGAPPDPHLCRLISVTAQRGERLCHRYSDTSRTSAHHRQRDHGAALWGALCHVFPDEPVTQCAVSPACPPSVLRGSLGKTASGGKAKRQGTSSSACALGGPRPPPNPARCRGVPQSLAREPDGFHGAVERGSASNVRLVKVTGGPRRCTPRSRAALGRRGLTRRPGKRGSRLVCVSG